MTMEKKTAAVIFGGQSSEHVVSCMSAANVIDRINTDKYNLILIGITQEGKWLKVDSVQAIRMSPEKGNGFCCNPSGCREEVRPVYGE